MANIKIEDIAFWIIISLIIGLAIWMLSGSRTDTSAIIAICAFVAGSEILIWRTIFKFDSKATTGFEKVKTDIKLLENNLTNELKNIQKEIKKTITK